MSMSKISPGASWISDHISSNIGESLRNECNVERIGGHCNPPCTSYSSGTSNEFLNIIIQGQFKAVSLTFPFCPFLLRSIINEVFESILKSRTAHNLFGVNCDDLSNITDIRPQHKGVCASFRTVPYNDTVISFYNDITRVQLFKCHIIRRDRFPSW